MPDFLITSPDGTKYQVTGPEGSTEQDALAQVQAQLAPKSTPVSAGGLAKAGAAGVGEGVAGLLGAPADLTDLALRGVDALTGKNARASAAGLTKALGSENIKKTIEGYTGEFYKPQNAAEGVLNTAGSFAPLLATGPGGVARKLLTNVVAPTVGSEAAGALTSGTDAEPYARAGGALLGMGGASKLGRSIESRNATIAAAPTAEMRAVTSKGYDDLTAQNVATPIAQSELNGLSSTIRADLNKEGLRPSVADKAHNALKELEVPGTKGAPDVVDLVAARQTYKNLLGSPDANSAAAAKALGHIDTAIERLSPGTMSKIKDLDQQWGAVRANEALDKKMARAELRAAGAGSGMNVGNKIRQKTADLLLSKDARYLSDASKADLEKVVRGTTAQNAVRIASNMLGGGGGIASTLVGVGGAGAGYASGHPEFAAAPFLGMGLRSMGSRMTANQAAKAAANIRNRTPYGQQQLQQTIASLQQSNSPIAQALLKAMMAQQQASMPMLSQGGAR